MFANTANFAAQKEYEMLALKTGEACRSFAYHITRKGPAMIRSRSRSRDKRRREDKSSEIVAEDDFEGDEETFLQENRKLKETVAVTAAGGRTCRVEEGDRIC